MTGACITDIYYDDPRSEQIEKKLDILFPEAGEKKKILYIPTLRFRTGSTCWLNLLDLEILSDRIGDKYAVMIHLNPEQRKAFEGKYYNVLEVPGFSRVLNLSEGITLRDLMTAADIIIGDYRDTFFEASILHKPVFSTAWDYEKICMTPNMSYNSSRFEAFLFCPVVRSEEDLARQIMDIDGYDYAPMDEFRKRMLGNCDGGSCKRLAEFVRSRP